MKPKVNDFEIKKKVIELLKETQVPCSVDHIAKKVNLSWGTSRAILLGLVIEGKISVMKTTSGLVFWADKKE